MSDFTESLFGCFDDMKSCVCVAFIPCGAACTQATAVLATDPINNSYCSAYMLNLYLCCIGATINREKIRSKLGYDAQCMGSFAVHFFCMPCGICQESREVQKSTIKNIGQGIEGAVAQIGESTPLNA